MIGNSSLIRKNYSWKSSMIFTSFLFGYYIDVKFLTSFIYLVAASSIVILTKSDWIPILSKTVRITILTKTQGAATLSSIYWCTDW